MTYEDAREKIAQSLFDVWIEAKQSESDEWDNTQWENLPEKHQYEYYLTAESIILSLLSPSQIAAWKAGGELVILEIPDGKYCRDATPQGKDEVCNFFWESEDGDTGCCLLDKSTFIEGDISQVPKFDDCPNSVK